jgi:signal transduction histidine kinase
VFLLAALLALTLLPLASGSVAWLVERQRQEADIHQRLRAATAYVAAHREGLGRDKAVVLDLGRRLEELHLLAQLTLIDKGVDKKPKNPVFSSPQFSKGSAALGSGGRLSDTFSVTGPDPGPAAPGSWRSIEVSIPIGAANTTAAFVGTLYYRPAGSATRALAALAAGVLVLLAGLAITVWLAGRWIVNPLSRLSNEVDKIAGGDLAVTALPSRISEVANVAAAIGGMASALGESGQQQAAADEARRFLVTAVAHDLRTPLFALRGHLEAITGGLGDPAEHLARAQDRAASLERLIASLFTYARHDYAPQEPLLEVALLGDLIKGVVASFEPALLARGGAFLLDGDDDLAVVADRERLERVLGNIVDNAVRHSPGAAVEVAWFEHGSAVEVTVADRGPGIDADLLPQIFEPMVRGDSSRNAATGGAGLGLTIAERLIESQGGTIAATNRQDGGAEFTLTLRRAELIDREATPFVEAAG